MGSILTDIEDAIQTGAEEVKQYMLREVQRWWRATADRTNTYCSFNWINDKWHIGLDRRMMRLDLWIDKDVSNFDEIVPDFVGFCQACPGYPSNDKQTIDVTVHINKRASLQINHTIRRANRWEFVSFAGKTLNYDNVILNFL